MSAEDESGIIYRRAGRGFSKRSLRLFFERLGAEVAGGRSFLCLITDDRELRRLNREFLGLDYPTDVLSFPAEDGFTSAGNESPLGEIAVSMDRAREQAAEIGHPVEKEIEILMLHGLLHLMGLDHETDKGKMASTEKQWRERLGLPSGLIERAAK
jgi:probable rRNA maturation factor